MIAKLKGKVIDEFSDFIIMDVGGVGYKLEGIIGVKINQELELFIYTHVREQEIRLFGFRSKPEFLMFEKLLSVSGVGPKVAIAILSSQGIDNVLKGIIDSDVDFIKCKGVGKKTSQKIILELKGKVDDLGYNSENIKTQNKENINDLRNALQDLGYTVSEINTFLEDQYDDDLEVEDNLKLALKYLQSR